MDDSLFEDPLFDTLPAMRGRLALRFHTLESLKCDAQPPKQSVISPKSLTRIDQNA
ncbi:MAG: hypothetical protein MI923_12220 [Phycisphaerales bacterium]|nr:hypothetical protein [Phycisphaerales bacterium]